MLVGVILPGSHRGHLMRMHWISFMRDEKGPELVEWVMVTLVLLLASGLLLIQIYDEVLAMMERILMQLLG